MLTSQSSTEDQVSNDSSADLLAEIVSKGWWQGAAIESGCLAEYGEGLADVPYWVITSQTCNLYNASFESIPVFEVVAAKPLHKNCDPLKSKGDNPRTLHVEVTDSSVVALELDIQSRRWLRREILAKLPAPKCFVVDASEHSDKSWLEHQWLDNMCGWLGRSYTRVALPNEFNEALSRSKLDNFFRSTLAKHSEKLYGIYLSIEHDADEPWIGPIGKIPPPYNLGITLVLHEKANPLDMQKVVDEALFAKNVPDRESNDEKPQKITRAEVARRHGIRLIREGVELKSVAQVNLLDLKRLIRYSIVDFLSDSNMATAQNI